MCMVCSVVKTGKEIMKCCFLHYKRLQDVAKVIQMGNDLRASLSHHQKVSDKHLIFADFLRVRSFLVMSLAVVSA